MEAMPRVHVHNTFVEVETDEDLRGWEDVDSGFHRAATEPVHPSTMAARTPTPTSDQEGSPMAECGGPQLHDFHMHGGCSVLWAALPQQAMQHQQQQQQQPVVPKAQLFGSPGLAGMPQPMGPWTSPYQPPQFHAPGAGMHNPAGGGGMDVGGGAMCTDTLSDQLKALERDPDFAHVFSDIRRDGASAAFRAFQDEGLMLRLSKKISGCPAQSADAKAGNGPAHCGVGLHGLAGVGPMPGGPIPMPKAQCQPRAQDFDGRLAAAAHQGGAPGGSGTLRPMKGHGAPLRGPPPAPGGEHHHPAAAPAPAGHRAPRAAAAAPKPQSQGQQQHQQRPQQPAPGGQGLAAIDASHVISGTQRMDEGLVTQVVQNTIRSMQCCVTLADPSMDDCPLIGCSECFEAMTGYSRQEILGRNCRFLNAGVEVNPEIRDRLRAAVRGEDEFMGTLPNRRKNGEFFQNLLRLTTLTVRGKKYIIGIQADITDLGLDIGHPHHVDELQAICTRIFSGNVDAWVQMQAREFAIRQPVPYSQVLLKSDPARFLEARDGFVTVSCQQKGFGAGATQAAGLHRVDPDAHPGSQAAAMMAARRAEEGAGGDKCLSEADSEQFAPTSARDMSASQEVHGATLKSVGSSGHPDFCQAECVFHFFRGGCKSGQACRFCHEFHPRKNAKKNKRALRKFIANTRAQEGAASEQGDALDDVSACGNADGPAAIAGGASVSACQASDARSALGPEDGSEPEADQGEQHELIRIHYGGQTYPAGAQMSVVFAVGQAVRLPLKVEISVGCHGSLEGCLEFSVEPALPAGLSLEGRSGLIAGSPLHAADARAYTITAGTKAVGPGGIDLGLVPLAACTLAMSVVDLSSYTLCWGAEDRDGSLTLTFEGASSS